MSWGKSPESVYDVNISRNIGPLSLGDSPTVPIILRCNFTSFLVVYFVSVHYVSLLTGGISNKLSGRVIYRSSMALNWRLLGGIASTGDIFRWCFKKVKRSHSMSLNLFLYALYSDDIADDDHSNEYGPLSISSHHFYFFPWYPTTKIATLHFIFHE